MTFRMVTLVAALMMPVGAFAQAPASRDATAGRQVKYVKYQAGNRTAWGILENETTIREISAAPWDNAKPTGRTAKLAEVRLMAPAEAKKVIAAGLNYKSHIGQASTAKYVGLFAKFPTSLVGHEADIIYPADEVVGVATLRNKVVAAKGTTSSSGQE